MHLSYKFYSCVSQIYAFIFMQQLLSFLLQQLFSIKNALSSAILGYTKNKIRASSVVYTNLIADQTTVFYFDKL